MADFCGPDAKMDEANIGRNDFTISVILPTIMVEVKARPDEVQSDNM